MSTNVDEFIEYLAKRDFIVFAGAGVPPESAPPITWKDLLAAFKEKEPDLAARDIDKVRENEYPAYAQEIFNALQTMGRESRYYEILREKLRATNARCSLQQRDIIETAQHVVTTNFDDSFKNAMDRELEGSEDLKIVQILPDFRLSALNTGYSVSYLHGNTNEECIVFKTEDYTTFYPSQSENDNGNDSLEHFLRCLYTERTIVFIGVSFNDEYLLNALTRTCNRIKQNDEVGRKKKVGYKSKVEEIQHYAFMPEDMGIKAEERYWKKGDGISEQQIEEERNRRKELLAELKINVITYKEPVEWTDWFKDIRERRKKPKQGKTDVFSVEDPSKVSFEGVKVDR